MPEKEKAKHEELEKVSGGGILGLNGENNHNLGISRDGLPSHCTGTSEHRCLKCGKEFTVYHWDMEKET